MSEREAFESWFKSLNENGRMTYFLGQESTITWEAWQAAKLQIAKSQVDTKWISVKAQLPPNNPYNREYWVYETLNNRVQHDYWVCPDSESGQDFKPFFNNWFDSVTHWMPMVKYPNPPTQEQELNDD